MRKSVIAVTAVALAVLTACSGGSDSSDSKPAISQAGTAEAAESPPAAKQSTDVKITSSKFEDHDVWGPNAYVVRYTVTNRARMRPTTSRSSSSSTRTATDLGSTGVTAETAGSGEVQER